MSQQPNEEKKQPWVLIVEDNKEFSALIAEGLHSRGVQVLEATNSFEALALVLGPHKGDIAAILTDIHMPEGSGIELVSALHLLKSGIPVYLMTGDAAFDSVRAIAMGARGVFNKPFSVKHAVETIVSVLNRQQIRQAAGL
jgi:two-component system nitrogen regulation response regulator GlnG